MDKINFDFEVKYWVLILSVASSIVSVLMYYLFSSSNEVTIALGIIGSNVALATLVYTAMNLHNVLAYNELAMEQGAKHHLEILEIEKKKHSSEVISEWQNPEMSKIITKGYEIRNRVRDMDGNQIAEFLKENREHHESLVCIFNYFERVSHLVTYEVVNEEILKDYFFDLIKVYYHCFRGFVEYKQREMNSNQVLSSFIGLYHRWENS
ncbi:DUF4760 domain-containing protein [Enterovibrio calviensis]|uniref:DUF4760 domain-containing protein n=1 Tax=Enterovibrio calviensis TaxID=91359 RepID=UPI00047F0DB6|nr:DUF4760 domain-containing protein [Enterovibrio calviensis]